MASSSEWKPNPLHRADLLRPAASVGRSCQTVNRQMSPAKVSVVLASLLLQQSWAQEVVVPQRVFGLYGKRVPVCFASPRGRECSGRTADVVLVTPVAPKVEALVQIGLTFDGGHSCKLEEGRGEWRAGHLEVTPVGEAQCKVHLFFSNGGVEIRDDRDRPCSRSLCGFVGNLKGFLPKRGSL